MTNLYIMKRALNRLVITPLLVQGFTGKWPHYKRVFPDHIELLTFQTNKYGGSFTVELSAVFPHNQVKNYSQREGVTLDNINVWETNRRHRLKGMYNGWFYYRDLYKHRSLFSGTHWLDVNEKEAEGFQPPRGYTLVQRFDEETAEQICHCVNQQLLPGFAWLDGFVKKNL